MLFCAATKRDSVSPLDILLRLVYFCFDISSPYNVVLCCYQKRFSFSLRYFNLAFTYELFVLDWNT